MPRASRPFPARGGPDAERWVPSVIFLSDAIVTGSPVPLPSARGAIRGIDRPLMADEADFIKPAFPVFRRRGDAGTAGGMPAGYRTPDRRFVV